jgi:hypothetical protein
MEVKFRNLTPHAVHIVDPACAEFDPRTRSSKLNGERKLVMTLAPEGGPPPRCSTKEVELGVWGGVPIIGVEFGSVEGLPPAEDGTFLIVSAIAANAAKAQGREDVLIPARLVRDGEGQIVGCLALARP